MEDKELLPCPFEWFTRRVNKIREPNEGLTFYMSPMEIDRLNIAFTEYKSRATPQISGLKQVRDNVDKLSGLLKVSDKDRKQLLDCLTDIYSTLDGIIGGQDAPYDPVLTGDLRVGVGIFRKGVKLSTVQGSIDRHINKAPTPAQPEKLDVEKLKRHCGKNPNECSRVRCHVPSKCCDEQANKIWNDCIDHLSATYDFVRRGE